jgi:heme-degrading monooxygenase HmoA
VVVKGELAYTSEQPRKEDAMSVLVLFRWEGDPDELLAAYDRVFENPIPREQPQRKAHTCARADDGVVIVDVWHSREDFQKMMDDLEFQKNLQAGRRSRSSLRSTRHKLASPKPTSYFLQKGTKTRRSSEPNFRESPF